MGNLLTFQQIIESTQISPSCFQKYRTLGLLPRPVKRDGLGGRGSVTYYPANVIELIRWIRQWQADGETLKQIRERLAGMHDVTPSDEKEILIEVDSDSLDSFTQSYAKAITDIQRGLDPENPPPKDFWVRFEFTEKNGKRYYKVVSALSKPK